MDQLLKDEFTILEEYINDSTKILARHNVCGYEWPITPHGLLRKTNSSRCPQCSRSIKKDTEIFKKEVHNKYDDEFTVLGEYVNANTKIMIKHNICEEEFLAIPNDLLRGHSCSVCEHKKTADKQRLTFKEVKKNIESIDGYKLISLSYKKNSLPLDIKCPIGHNFQMDYSHFYSTGQRCPICNLSKGEERIKQYLETIKAYLEQNNLYYERGYKIPDCKNINPLPFDFATLSKSGDLLFLIEYDGRQHYEVIEFFGGEEGLKQRQHNDKIKTNYCLANNIPLLRISYWDFDNIESILSDFLSSHISNTTNIKIQSKKEII